MLLPQDCMKSMQKNHHLACNYLVFSHAQNGTYCGPHDRVESHTTILGDDSVNTHHFLTPNILQMGIKIMACLTLEMWCISIYIILQSNMESRSQTQYWPIFMWSILIWHFEKEYGPKHQSRREFVLTSISAHVTKRCSPHLRWVLNLSLRTH